MASKQEVIMNIHYCLDTYDEHRLFGDGQIPDDADEPFVCSHVQLGSLGKVMHLSSYVQKLSKDIGLENLQVLLTTFLHLNHVPNAADIPIHDFEVCTAYIRSELHFCWVLI